MQVVVCLVATRVDRTGWAHSWAHPDGSDVLAWDDAKNAKLREERAIGVRGHHLPSSSAATWSTFSSIRTPGPVTPASAFRREDYVYLMPFVEDERPVPVAASVVALNSCDVR